MASRTAQGQPEIMSLLEDFGITQGFVIPIHSPDGYEGAVGMVGDKLDLSGETKPGIHLMAVYAVAGRRTLRHGAHAVEVLDLVLRRPPSAD